MDSAQKRQRSWLSGITSLVGGGLSSAINSPMAPAPANGASRPRAAPAQDMTPSQPRNTFSAPSPGSPESPVKRASPALLAQRKIIDRPRGPSGKLAANPPPKTTNFSAATTPRNIFRGSVSAARDAPAYSFSPRIPPNTHKASFPPETPGRSYRASTLAPSSSRRPVPKPPASDLFLMRIPEPDANLTGEAISKMVPQDISRSGSIYASEFLAHLCPPEFNQEQRNQYFCVLDLRRLKYAANEIFLKKDWKLNILNFAKEYEKSRSLIMLRYGLYEFKTVKVSQEVFQKWRKENNVASPDEESPFAPAPRVNGTGSVFGATKRKAQDDPTPSGAAHSTPTATQTKRARTAEVREPLAETTTPALNNAQRRVTVYDEETAAPPSSKRKAAAFGVDEDHRNKTQKKAATPSATKAFFEKVANSPMKEREAPAATAPAPTIHISKPSADDSAPLKPKHSSLAPTPKVQQRDILARSVFDGGLKAAPTQGNIFHYLSDGSSAKGSGNDNADADVESSDEEESSTHQSDEPSVAASGEAATPQPSSGAQFSMAKSAPAATGSSASSETSDVASGRSILDRINKDRNGQPIRVTASETAAPLPFGSKVAPESAPIPEKAATAAPTNKTWTPDTPIKFSAMKPGLDTAAPKAAPLFGSRDPAAPSAGLSLASSTQPNGSTPSVPVFNFQSKPAEPAANMLGSKLFGSTPLKTTQSIGDIAKPSEQPSVNMFAAAATPIAAASGSTVPPKNDTANVAPVMQSHTLFGGTSKLGDTAKSPQPPPPASLPPASGSLFPNFPSSGAISKDPQVKPEPSASPAFGFGNIKQDGAKDKAAAVSSAPKSLFPSVTAASTAGQDAKPLFGTAPSGQGSGAPMAQSSIFGNTSTPIVGSDASKGSVPSFFNAGMSQTGSFLGSSAPKNAAPLFGTSAPQNSAINLLGPSASSQGSKPLFGLPASKPSATPMFDTASFGGSTTASGGSGFNFSVPGTGDKPFNNPFASANSSVADTTTPSFNFGSSSTPGGPFQFQAGNAAQAAAASGPSPANGNTMPTFSFGAQPASAPALPSSGSLFGGAPGSTPMFGAAAPQSTGLAPAQPNIFAPPLGGTSTGTSKLFRYP